ncbi:MAG: isochorismatase family protein [Betaproteobacteria bacterium]|nr:isochorismatase family protein [Betaproteobacteria bacterium]
MPIWDNTITERDRQVYATAGYGARQGLGVRPALLVIDMTYAFTGDRREPVLESSKRWPNSCGEAAFDAVAQIRRMLDAARANKVPVIYTRGEFLPGGPEAGRWAGKVSRMFDSPTDSTVNGDEIVKEIAPQPGDIVIKKDKPSAFFCTPLVSYLVERGIDSLVVAGCTTSGCVRASVIDAFSYNYKVAVVEEGVFDRGEVTHAINLFDMNSKYADVIGIEAALTYLKSCAPAA